MPINDLTWGLLNPAALVFFAIVPALILAYLTRERPARVIVSSVIAFRALREFRRRRFAGWPRLDWTFFVEMLVLCLAVLALAGPYLARRVTTIAVVLDNSAAMQARLPEGGSRFEKVRRELDADLAHRNAVGVAFYLSAPKPHEIGGGQLSLSQARSELAAIEPIDAPNDGSAVASLLTDLCSSPRFTNILYAGARPLAPPAPPKVSAMTVGDPIDNFAIGSFTLRRESFGAPQLHAYLTIANFSTRARDLSITVTGDGRPVGTATRNLGPGETSAVEFPKIASAQVYQADLSPADGFPLDNVAYATAGSLKTISILFVSPTPADAGSLESIPGVSVTAKSPDSFTPSDLDNIDLAIFEFSVPKELPTVNTLLVMPPAGDPVLGFNTISTGQVQITGWSPVDPLTESVNFRMLNIAQAEVFGVHPWMAPVVSAPGGGLLLEGQRQGHRFIAAGFNPFPYLGKQNLPMSILTLNILGYLAGVGANSAGYRTGEPWLVPAGVDKVQVPSGARVDATPGTLFTDVAYQGIYQLIGPGNVTTPRAVNFADLTASDLENVPPLHIIEAAPSSVSSLPAETALQKSSFSRFILMAILALLALEALIIYRRRRRPLEA